MMMTTTFSERLNLCLDKLGFPPKHYGRIQLLADMVGLTHRGAGKWISGQCSPPAGKFPILAKQLQVNEGWLRTGEGAMSPARDVGGTEQGALGVMQHVPIYIPSHLLQSEKSPYHTLTCILPYMSNFCGIVLSTEAMSPRFPIGSMLIFDMQAIPKDGDFVLVSDKVYPEPIFRQFIASTEHHYLYAYNPKFERMIFRAEQTMLGKLVQAIVSFE